MSNKWIYGVFGVGVASLIVYAFVYKKDKPYEPPAPPSPDEVDPDTGLTYAQATVDPSVLIYLQPSQNQQGVGKVYESGPAKGKRIFTNNRIKGKKISTKVDAVKLRSYAHVNNGFVNNIIAEVDKDIVLGDAQFVTSEVDIINGADGVTINPKTKEPYKWVNITLSDSTTDLINKNKSWYQPNLPKGKTVYARDDTIKIV
jgi:hypothetical protein